MISCRIGRYEAIAWAGDDGGGSVCKAHDTLLGRPIALKLLAPHLLGSEGT